MTNKKRNEEDLKQSLSEIFEIFNTNDPRIGSGCVHIIIDIHAHDGEILDTEVVAIKTMTALNDQET